MPKLISQPNLSVILPRWDEPTVIEMTKDNLHRELLSLPGSELIVCDSWLEGIGRSRADMICLVEPDCLVSSGYFNTLYKLFKKNNQFRKLAMLGSTVGLNNWGNQIYGYHLEKVTYGLEDNRISQWEIQPFKEKRSSSMFSIQVCYLPGALIRRSALQAILEEFEEFDLRDPVKLSTNVSFFLWDSGRRVYVNPSTTYVSTQANDNPEYFKWRDSSKAMNLFEAERI